MMRRLINVVRHGGGWRILRELICQIPAQGGPHRSKRDEAYLGKARVRNLTDIWLRRKTLSRREPVLLRKMLTRTGYQERWAEGTVGCM